MIRRKLIGALGTIILLSVASTSHAQIVQYSDPASWSSAVSSVTEVNLPDSPAFLGFGSAASATYSGVKFSQNGGNADLFLVTSTAASAPPEELSSQAQVVPGTSNIEITFPEPVYGFSFNYGTVSFSNYASNRSISPLSLPVVLQLSNGGSVTAAAKSSGGYYYVPGYIGITDTKPFTSILLTTNFTTTTGANDFTELNIGNIAYASHSAKLATTITLKIAPSTAPEGAPISLTALVSASSGTTTPGGTVTFKSGTKTLGKVTLNATGQGTLTINSLPVGIDSVVAIYSGSSAFDASTSATVKVTIAAAPVVTFTPNNVTFPSTIVGTATDDQVVTLTNSGSGPLSITAIGLKGAQANSFVEISSCGASLAVGKSCAVYVGFTPKKSGSATATLSVADNAAESPQTVTLTGTGVSARALTIAPTKLVFPATPVGGSSVGLTVTLTNSGTTVVSISSIALSGADPGDFVTLNNCGAGLAAGASCTVFVAFTPVAVGARTAALSVKDDASATPQTVTLSGTAK